MGLSVAGLIACSPIVSDSTPTSRHSESPISTETQLAPTAEPSPTVERVFGEWTSAEAVTVRINATDEEIKQAIEVSTETQSTQWEFPIHYYESEGVWVKACLLESISFLKESSYIKKGDFTITVTGRCSYLDANHDLQTITLALFVENSKEGTTAPPGHGILPAKISPSFIQDFLKTWTTTGGESPELEIKPGTIISLQINLPNATNAQIYPQVDHHGDLIAAQYTQTQLEEYAQTGDPEALGGFLIPIEARTLEQSELFK